MKAERARRLSAELHAAMSACQWSKALGAAEAWLELAPDSPPAREARRRAWSAVGTRFQDTLPVTSETRVDDAADRPDAGRRFLMWIDAVGGYLVCTGDKIVLGQPVPGNHVDVPIMGDVSQRHAVIRRDGEGYLLEAIRPCRVDGRDVPGVAALADGATIELGDSVKLLFRRPHPLSATARLEFISGHRTQPATDGVLLMAGTCMLGPTANAHVICLDWQREMMLFEQQGELYCRTKGPFEIDGASCSDRGLVTPGSHVSGEDFSVQLEEI